MNLFQDPSIQSLTQYAYMPSVVYTSTIAMMLGSAFGLPIPEEITIVSLGLIAYIGSNPHLFPPIEGATHAVSVLPAALICFAAVFLSDCLVFTIGRTVGRKISTWGSMKSIFNPKVMGTIDRLTHKYGVWGVAIFRFTPGLRFPAHILLGMSPLPLWKFLAVDGLAALLSVPTQIIIIAHYGEVILGTLHQFKVYFFVALAIAFLFLLIKKLMKIIPRTN